MVFSILIMVKWNLEQLEPALFLEYFLFRKVRVTEQRLGNNKDRGHNSLRQPLLDVKAQNPTLLVYCFCKEKLLCENRSEKANVMC